MRMRIVHERKAFTYATIRDVVMNVRMNRSIGLSMLVVLCLAVTLFTAGCTDDAGTSPVVIPIESDVTDIDTSAPVDETPASSLPGISGAGDYVEVDYTGTLADGEVFDSSVGLEPLGFVLAGGSMIPGFDAAVHGMAVGETKTVDILSEEAYGEWTEEMILEIPRDIATEEEEPPVAGETIYLFSGMGFVPVTVLEVTDEAMIVDANHQLAGEDLSFEITMLKIVKPDDPEHPNNIVSTDTSSTQEFVIEVPEPESAE